MALWKLVVLLMIISLGQASFISINVGKQKKAAGSPLKLRCNYNSSQVGNITWTKIDGDATVRGEKIEEPNALSLKFSSLQITDSGNYTCSGRQAGGNRASASVEIIVYIGPDVSRTPTTQNFVLGETATVVCLVEGDPKPKTTWGRTPPLDNARVSFLGDNLIIPNVTKADEGKYRCEAEQTSMADFRDVTVQVIINSPPKIHHRKKKKIVIAGETATLSCSAKGDPAPDISWYKVEGDSLMTKQSDSSKFTLNVNQSLDGAVFKCVALNIAGNDTSTTRLKVYVKPTINMTERLTVVEGENAELKCVTEGVPAPNVSFYDIYQNEIDKNEKVSLSTNETLGNWSSDMTIKRGKNSLTLELSRIKYTDKGMYECFAENEAGHTSSYVELDVLYAPKPKKLSDKWACENSDIVVGLRCQVDANPTADFTWYKVLSQDGADETGNETGLLRLNESSLPDGYRIDRDGDDSLLSVNVFSASDPFGEYICQATNELGNLSEPLKLRKAGKPLPPYEILVTDVGARDATIEFEVPASGDHTPYTKFIVTLTQDDGDDVSIRTKEVDFRSDEWRYTHQFTGLEHNTEYFVEVVTENCGGLSNSSESESFQTRRIGEPTELNITSDFLSNEFDRYTVEWTLGDLGGGEIKNITINLYKVVDGIDSAIDEHINTFLVPASKYKLQDFFELSGLDQLSSYKVRINITNDGGSAIAFKEFSTSAEKELESGGKLPIFIVVAVLLGIVVIIDLACCCLKNLGLSFLIYSRTCMRRPRKHADVEGGVAQFRALSKIDETDEPNPSTNKEVHPSPNGNKTAEESAEPTNISKEHNE